MGSLFFIIFSADIPNCFDHSYADDTQIQRSVLQSDAVETVSRFNRCLDSVFKYSHNHDSKLNRSKTAIISFGLAKYRAAQNLDISKNRVKFQLLKNTKNWVYILIINFDSEAIYLRF